MGGHVHPLTKTAPIREIPAKVQAAAQVRMPLLAGVAPSAGLRRVDRHSHSRLQRIEVTIEGIRAHRLDSPRKFVPKHQWTLNGGISDPRVLVGMEVAAANARCTDTEQDLTRSRRPTMRDLLHAQVA